MSIKRLSQFCPIFTSASSLLWTGFFFVSVSSKSQLLRGFHISPFDTFALPAGLYFFTPSFHLPFSSHDPGYSGCPDRLFASLEARVRQFATPRYKNSHLRNAADQSKKRKVREVFSYQRSKSTYATPFLSYFPMTCELIWPVLPI